MYKKHIDAIIAAWNDGNMDGLDAYVAENTKRIAPATLNSNADNLGELKDEIKKFQTAFPDGKITLRNMITAEDRVITEWTFTGTNTGPGDFPSTGRSINVSGSSIATFENNKLVEERVYFDVMEMMMQLGIIELPAGA